MEKYEISKEFKIFRKLRLPLNKALLPLGNAVLTCAPKNLKSNKQFNIAKHNIASAGSSIKLIIISPKTFETNKVLLYVHGGAFTYKAIKPHFDYCKSYALSGKCKVVFVDYKLAPKHKYPKQVENCFDAYCWIINNAESLKINPHKIIVGGDSAGGYLAVLTTLAAHSRHKILPCAQMLIYPVLDCNPQTKSMQQYYNTPMWNAKNNKKMWEYFADATQPPISINKLPNVYFMPKTYIETAEYDCLHDEAVAFAQKLSANNVEVKLNETKGTMHGFDIVKSSEIVKQCLKQRTSFLFNIK